MNPLTPLYHANLDAEGPAVGTRIWAADGSFPDVADVEVGDLVFGVSYQIETEYVSRSENKHDNFVRVWRPHLVARRVLQKEVVEARAWELLFGDDLRAREDRRLVCGADTVVRVAPLAHDRFNAQRVHRLATAMPNPRVEPRIREAKDVDIPGSKQAGHLVYRPSPYSGRPAGASVVAVPYESYAGQTGLFDTASRPYTRYTFAQVHSVAPIEERVSLVKLRVQADTREDAGVLDQPRANIIVQTPFPPEEIKAQYQPDKMAPYTELLLKADRPEDVINQWDEYGREQQNVQETTRVLQQSFYETARTGALREYGLEEGFLNGGILCPLPPV